MVHSRLLYSLSLELASTHRNSAQLPAMDLLHPPPLWGLFRLLSTDSQVLRPSTIWVSPIHRRSYADVRDPAQVVGLHHPCPSLLSCRLYILHCRTCMHHGAQFVQDLP